jgi:hypothetical protein
MLVWFPSAPQIEKVEGRIQALKNGVSVLLDDLRDGLLKCEIDRCFGCRRNGAWLFARRLPLASGVAGH